MRILILGGTVFLGREIAAQARDRGHQVTLFNRGKSDPGYLPELERIQGDRDGGLDGLRGRTWDAVVDTCGYVPRIVGASARLLAPSVGHYTFVSSLSVYDDLAEGDPDEDSPLATTEHPEVEEITGESYGPLKALCENAATEAMDGRTLLVRPGLIVGPYDPSDRFTYWPVRASEGGRLLAPGRPDACVQVVDVRDLAAWTLDQVEAGTLGAANVAGPVEGCTMEGLLEACRTAAGAPAEFVWVPDEWLCARDLVPWGDLPLWHPETDITSRIDRAVLLGLKTRPVVETARDTLQWRTAPERAAKPLRAGIPRERMDELLAEWSRDGGASA
jgi:2'-hydroxyisoflavone reductase